MDDRTLYPIDYVEPEPGPPSEEGRDFVEVERLIESAVIKNSPPLTIEQITPLIIGRPGEPQLHVATAPIADLRAALLSGEGGLTADPRTSSVRRREVEAVFRAVWQARESTWTTLEPLPPVDGEPAPGGSTEFIPGDPNDEPPIDGELG